MKCDLCVCLQVWGLYCWCGGSIPPPCHDDTAEGAKLFPPPLIGLRLGICSQDPPHTLNPKPSPPLPFRLVEDEVAGSLMAPGLSGTAGGTGSMGAGAMQPPLLFGSAAGGGAAQRDAGNLADAAERSVGWRLGLHFYAHARMRPSVLTPHLYLTPGTPWRPGGWAVMRRARRSGHSCRALSPAASFVSPFGVGP